MTTQIFWTELDPTDPSFPRVQTRTLPDEISMDSAREIESIIREMAFQKDKAFRYALVMLERQRSSKKMLCDVLDILNGRDETPIDGGVII